MDGLGSLEKIIWKWMEWPKYTVVECFSINHASTFKSIRMRMMTVNLVSSFEGSLQYSDDSCGGDI